MAYMVELIYSTDRRGLGKDNDPLRHVSQYWSSTRNEFLILEADDWKAEVVYLGRRYVLAPGETKP